MPFGLGASGPLGMRSTLRFIFTAFLASCLLGQSMLAMAAGSPGVSTPPVVSYTGAGGSVVGGAIKSSAPSDFARAIIAGDSSSFGALLNKPFVPAANNGDVLIADKVATKAAGAAAADVEMILARRMPWAKVAGLATKAIPFVPLALDLYSIWKDLRVKPNADGSEGGMLDEGTEQTTQTVYCSNGAPYGLGDVSVCGAGPGDVGNQVVGKLMAGDPKCSDTRNPGAPVQSAVTYSLGRATATAWYIDRSGCGVTTVGYFSNAPSSTQRLACPSSIDASNPANSIPAGRPPNLDGKCETGRYTKPLNAIDAAKRFEDFAPKAKAPQVVKDSLDSGMDGLPHVSPEYDGSPGVLSGPSSAPGPAGGTTTTTSPGGTTTTTNSPGVSITYAGNTYNTTVNNTTVTNNGGSTTTTTTTGAAPDVKTCGLPGTSPCKIDESGTPGYVPPSDPSEQLKADDAAKRDAAMATVQDPGFGFIGAPPVAECTPYEYPNNMGSLNPCGVVNDVRSVMAFLWPLAAAWICFGFIRQTVNR